jgi:hypothetical protein
MGDAPCVASLGAVVWFGLNALLWYAKPSEPTRNREQNMAWIVSTVQSISLEEGAPELAGFFLGQSSSSAELTLVFEDATTAEECANAMKRILDKAVGIRAHVA